ncbi:chymotrypsinogen A-like [Ornithodoros turicata]|uniref:chymotrypsinogen A-like n=1 Tax=Ornithodoros turicata TaxID=34597 RepID=UPI00313A2582
MQALVLFIAVLGYAQATKCGIRKENSRVPRMSGGTDALPNEFPWQVAMTEKSCGWTDFNCGGSVVNDRWVVTAARCARKNASDYTVLVGKHQLRGCEATQDYRTVDKIIVHPKYNGKTFDYDVALMRLSTPLDLNDYVGPVCLPDEDDDYTNVTCTTSGWGDVVTKNGTFIQPETLQKVDLPVLSSGKCAKTFGTGYNRNSMICAGIDGTAKGPCSDDWGGPLVCPRNDGRWVLAGIASWGNREKCAGPAVYSRVTSSTTWIQDTICKDHNCS